LLSEPDNDPNKKNEEGDTALHIAITRTDLIVRPNDNFTFFIEPSYLDIFKELVTNKRLDLSAKNNNQETPFDIAVRTYCWCFFDGIENLDGEKPYLGASARETMNTIAQLIKNLMIQIILRLSSDEMILNGKYYSENPEQKQYCIKNLVQIYTKEETSNSFEDGFFRAMDKWIYPELKDLISTAKLDPRYTIANHSACYRSIAILK
jgi:hypothetical protein